MYEVRLPTRAAPARLFRSMKDRGPGETVRLMIAMAAQRAILSRLDRRLDASLDSDMAGRIPPEHLDFAEAGTSSNNGYQATSVLTLSLLLRALNIDVERFTFIDIGCGMGRSLCIASRFAFRRVVGVELSKALAKRAERNVATLKRSGKPRCRNIQIINGNALEFDIPREDCVIFLFNPFGAEILSEVLHNIEEAVRGGHKIYIIYQHPKHRSVVDASALFRPMTIPTMKEAIIRVLTPSHYVLYESIPT